ncbi:cupin domain-containing protein [Emticicia sp.]|uniref:cupin domain-containing protein n=1 Tax=Emticicia sp. TaxID=1930953 RepID=UPI003752C79B
MQRRKFLTNSSVVLALASTALRANAKSASKSFIVKAGEARFGIHTPFMGVNPNDVKISGKDTDGQLAVFEYIGTQKVGPSLHLHFDQDEIFNVVEGEYLFQVGEKQETLRAGDTIFLPRQIPHTWIQLSDRGKLTYFLQPAGKMEEFFLTMNNLKERPTMVEMNKIHAAHGMKVIGPPLSLK